MHRLLMAKQDSFASLSLAELGSRSEVPDRDAFIGCAGGAKAIARISADVAEASKLGVRGTPAVFVNGKASVPNSLRRAVNSALVSPAPTQDKYMRPGARFGRGAAGHLTGGEGGDPRLNGFHHTH